MGDTIKVGIADYAICKAPDMVTTIGLGSCVGVVIYDQFTKTCGLIHVMLPDSTRIRANSNKAKFADTGVPLLLEELKKKGCSGRGLKAKIAGGAKMFEFTTNNNATNVGDQNVEMVLAQLKKLGIPVVAKDVGLNFGRTVLFDPADASMKITAAGKPPKVI